MKIIAATILLLTSLPCFSQFQRNDFKLGIIGQVMATGPLVSLKLSLLILMRDFILLMNYHFLPREMPIMSFQMIKWLEKKNLTLMILLT